MLVVMRPFFCTQPDLLSHPSEPTSKDELLSVASLPDTVSATLSVDCLTSTASEIGVVGDVHVYEIHTPHIQQCGYYNHGNTTSV